MAKKKDFKKNKVSPELLSHYSLILKFKNYQDYENWCLKNNLSTSLNKSQKQMDNEIELYRETRAIKHLKTKKKQKNIPHFIKKIFSGKTSLKELKDEPLQIVFQAYKKQKGSGLLFEYLLFMSQHTNFFYDRDYVIGLLNLFHYSKDWIRDYQYWKPKSHNRDKQFSQLARFLFTKYDVPLFFDKIWFTQKRTPQKWFIHIGRGKNIRKAEDLPIKMTKKMAHYFLIAPDYYSLNGAFRWAQVHAFGGNKRIIDALLETRLLNDFRDETFVLSLLRFFIQYPMLDTQHYSPVIDYIWNQKYENQVVFIEHGVAENQDPPQPNFSMKGRTPETLLRQVNEWHRQLGREKKGKDLHWLKSSIDVFLWIQGKKQEKNMVIWRITELLSSRELIQEGRAMSHCVATYAHSCYKGIKTIWSLTREDKSGLHKQLTIEIHLASKEIMQMRGRFNRLPTKREIDVIKRWVSKEGLKIAYYLL